MILPMAKKHIVLDKEELDDAFYFVMIMMSSIRYDISSFDELKLFINS